MVVVNGKKLLRFAMVVYSSKYHQGAEGCFKLSWEKDSGKFAMKKRAKQFNQPL